jgi:hypothetical protein
MSSNQTKNFNSKKIVDPSDLQPNHYQPQTGNRIQVYNSTMLSSNLYLYIPRVGAGATQAYVEAIINRSNIGTAEYCDITLTKDKDPNKAAFLSAFVKLVCWSPASNACEDFARTKSIRIQLNRETGEFWMILPNHNPMARTYLNTTQIAAATDKLFEVTDEITEKAASFELIMRTQLAEMRALIWNQTNQIAALQHEVDIMRCSEANPIDLVMPRGHTYKDPSILGKPYLKGELYPELYAEMITIVDEEDEEAAELCRKTIEEEAKDDADLDAVLEAHLLQRSVERDFDAEVDALLDAPLPVSITRCMSYSAPPPFARGITFYDPMQTVKYQRSIPTMTRQTSVFQPQEDEAVEKGEDAMSIPTMTRQSSVSVYSEEDECIFSNKQKQRRSPIISQAQSQSQFAPSKSLSLGEIVAENLNRAIGSRDLCGNL